ATSHEPSEPAPIAAVLAGWRGIARAGGGHATLEWAPLAVKSQVPVWDDPRAAGRIMQRIKAELDPKNVLNPGRFVAGISPGSIGERGRTAHTAQESPAKIPGPATPRRLSVRGADACVPWWPCPASCPTAS